MKDYDGSQQINDKIVWRAPGALYGYCPKCGTWGEMRERIDGTGNDRCNNGHVYPSTEAKMTGKETSDAKITDRASRARRRSVRRVSSI